MVLQDIQFIRQSGVKIHIGVFPKGVDMAFFPSPDSLPALQGLQRAVPPKLIVTDNPPNLAHIGRGKIIMVIEIQLYKGMDVDIILLGIELTGKEVWIKGVDTLDNYRLFGG